MPEETVPTTESQAVPSPASEPGLEPESRDLDVGLLLLLGVIVVAVIVQNIWLRRRAQREKGAGADDA